MGVPFLADPENESPFKFSDSKLLELGRTRVWEDKVIKWIQAKRIELALPRVKPDGWDLPGGNWTKGEHPFVAIDGSLKKRLDSRLKESISFMLDMLKAAAVPENTVIFITGFVVFRGNLRLQVRKGKLSLRRS